eukprot:scaffold4239_cov156-Amphora_coffeaeformis.AAC.6
MLIKCRQRGAEESSLVSSAVPFQREKGFALFRVTKVDLGRRQYHTNQKIETAEIRWYASSNILMPRSIGN